MPCDKWYITQWTDSPTHTNNAPVTAQKKNFTVEIESTV